MYAILIILFSFCMMARAEVRVAMEDAVKAAINKPPPAYSPIAKQLKIVGKVEVEVTIDAGGNVENVKIVSGNAMLTPSVVAAVKRWTFTPFQQGGAPTKAITALEFAFKM